MNCIMTLLPPHLLHAQKCLWCGSAEHCVFHSLTSLSKSKPIFGAVPEMSWRFGIIWLQVTSMLTQSQELFEYLAGVIQYYLLALCWAC